MGVAGEPETYEMPLRLRAAVSRAERTCLPSSMPSRINFLWLALKCDRGVRKRRLLGPEGLRKAWHLRLVLRDEADLQAWGTYVSKCKQRKAPRYQTGDNR